MCVRACYCTSVRSATVCRDLHTLGDPDKILSRVPPHATTDTSSSTQILKRDETHHSVSTHQTQSLYSEFSDTLSCRIRYSGRDRGSRLSRSRYMHAHNRAKLPEASPPRVPRERRVQRARGEARLNDRVVDELPRRVVEVVLPVADLALALRHVARHAPERDRLGERGALRGRERPAEEGGDPVELRLEVELEVLFRREEAVS